MSARQGSPLKIFVPITKVDEEQRLVYGRLCAEEVDAAGEVFDYATSKPLFEKWSDDQFEASGGLSKGNVRAMHGSVAAGKLTELGFDDDAKAIEGCAKVVDDAEWAKVLEGVYTGFSIGGKYEKRWKADDLQRYTARPVEVSLVDSPCVKSARFSVVKSDGTVEDRLFKGADIMAFSPTNDAILAKATELAKAADGKTEADWLEFSDEAREALIAEHVGKADEGEEQAQEEQPGDKPAGDAAAPEASDEAAGGGPAADAAPEAAGAGDEGAAKVDAPAPDIVEEGNLEQVWKARDGSTHAKKADAIAHNEKLAKSDGPETPAAEPEAVTEPSLVETLTALKADVAKVAADEEVPTGFDALPLDQRLNKWADFLSDSDVVEKSLYSVERTARTMRECASLYIYLKQEQEREGDGSSVPATVMTAVEALGEALIAGASEEVSELLVHLREGNDGQGGQSYVYPDYYCELAAGTMGLEKADAPAFFDKAISISGKDQARLQKIHDHASALGAVCADAGEDDLEVEEVPEDEAAKLAKRAPELAAENEELRKTIETQGAEITRASDLVKGIVAEVEELKKRAAPRVPQTHVVGKGEDVSGQPAGGLQNGNLDDALAAMVQKFGSDAVATAMIKVAQANGRQMGAAS